MAEEERSAFLLRTQTAKDRDADSDVGSVSSTQVDARQSHKKSSLTSYSTDRSSNHPQTREFQSLQSKMARKKKPKAFQLFNESMQLIEYDETTSAESIKKIKSKQFVLHDPWTANETRSKNKNDAPTMEQVLKEWEKQRLIIAENRRQDLLVLQKLRQMQIHLQGTRGATQVLDSEPAMRAFEQCCVIDAKLRAFKSLSLLKKLRVFVSSNNLPAVRQFLHFLEQDFKRTLEEQQPILKKKSFPRLNSTARKHFLRSVKFSTSNFTKAKLYLIEENETVERKGDRRSWGGQSQSECSSVDFTDDESEKFRLKTRLDTRMHKKPVLPFRWRGYLKVLGNLSLELKYVTQALIEFFARCLNSSLLQSLLSYEPSSGFGSFRLIKFLVERQIPMEMISKPFPPSLFAMEPDEVDLASRPNPLVLVDRYYSRNRSACAKSCSFHEGKLLLLLVSLGMPQVVKYCLDHGFSANQHVCGTITQQIGWRHGAASQVNDLGRESKDIRVSNFAIATPLAVAAEHSSHGGDPAVLLLLLKKEADPLAVENLAVRNCVASLGMFDEMRVNARRDVLAVATRCITNRWNDALQAWKEKNAKNLRNARNPKVAGNLKSTFAFKLRVAETKIKVDTTIYFDVAFLFQALLTGNWLAAEVVLTQTNPAPTSPSKASGASAVSHIELEKYNTQKPTMLQSNNTLRRSLNAKKSLRNWKSASNVMAKKNPRNRKNTQTSNAKENVNYKKGKNLSLHEIVAMDSRKIIPSLKILDHYYAIRAADTESSRSPLKKKTKASYRSWAYDNKFPAHRKMLFIFLRTVDRLLNCALKSSSNSSQNLQGAKKGRKRGRITTTNINKSNSRSSGFPAELKLETAGNSSYILSILVLLERTSFHLDNRRLKFLVALLVKTITEFKPGDATAISYLLKNPQIRSFLRLSSRVTLCDDPQNVSNLINEKILQIVFDVPKIKKVKRKAATGTLRRTTRALSRRYSLSAALGTKSRAKKSSLLITSKMSISSSTTGDLDEYSVQIEPPLFCDLLEKAASNGFGDFVLEMLSDDVISSMGLTLSILPPIIEAAVFSRQISVLLQLIEFIDDLPEPKGDLLKVAVLPVVFEVALIEEVCCPEVFEIDFGMSMKEIIEKNNSPEAADSIHSVPFDDIHVQHDLGYAIPKFLLDSLVKLNFTNNPRGATGNSNRKRCFQTLLAQVKDSNYILEFAECKRILTAVGRSKKAVWSFGLHQLLAVVQGLGGELGKLVSESWASNYVDRVCAMPRPTSHQGRIEIIDLLSFLSDDVLPRKGRAKEKIKRYLRKIDQDVTRKAPRRRLQIR